MIKSGQSVAPKIVSQVPWSTRVRYRCESTRNLGECFGPQPADSGADQLALFCRIIADGPVGPPFYGLSGPPLNTGLIGGAASRLPPGNHANP